MKILIALLALSWSVTLNADVVIYKFVQTNVLTGDGVSIKQKVSGRLVFDRDTLTATTITELPALRYQIDCPTLDAKYFDAPKIVNGRVRGRISTAAFFLKGDGYNSVSGDHVSNMQAFWRGNNSTVLIGTDKYLLTPKILKGTYQGSYVAAGGATVVIQANVVASFMGADTIAANNAGQTVVDAINSLIDLAHSRGYTQVDSEAPCD